MNIHVNGRSRALPRPAPASERGPGPRSTGGQLLSFRLVPLLFSAFAIALIPWIIYLKVSPAPGSHHSNHFWVLYDVALMAALGGTAWLLHRRRREAPLVALATAGLLIFDACLDIMWATTTHQVIAAIARAAFIELPIAVFALYVSLRLIRTQLVAAYRVSRRRLHACTQSSRSGVSRPRSHQPAALCPRSRAS